MSEKNADKYEDVRGAGGNVILTRLDGKPTLVNLFRLVTADPLPQGGTAVTIETPKAIAGAATSGQYSSGNREFKVIDCTETIEVREAPQEIVQKQAAAMALCR